MSDEPQSRARIRGIVVGYDGSPGADVALDWAIEAARRDDQCVTVLVCAELSALPPLRYDVGADLHAVDERSRGILRSGVDRATAALGEDNVSGVTSIGSAPGELVSASRQADLVVTGSRGRGRLRSGLLGSTAYQVAAHAECPVVIVRGEPHEEQVQIGPQGKIIVGVDDSAGSEQALDVAAEMAAVAEAPLHIVRVAETASIDAWAYAESVSAHTDAVEPLREYAEKAVTRAADRVRGAHPGVEVESHVLYGVPGQMIAEFGEGAALIVLGSRGHGGFVGMLLGSVSHSVIHHGSCPVMIVR